MIKNSLKYFIVAVVLITTAIVGSCKKDPAFVSPNGGVTDKNGWVYNPTPYALQIPNTLPPAPAIPSGNPLTKQGIQLGRMLFYDPILSSDSTLSCSGCHRQEYAFSDGGKTFSTGITGQAGTRNAPPLFNLIYDQKFFWDGRANSLQDQVNGPVTNPIEMASNWPGVIAKLQRSKIYPKLIYEAFGIEPDSIKPLVVENALAQFELTIISANSPFDQYKNNQIQNLSTDAINGAILVQTGNKGDCGHCHGDYLANTTFMDLTTAGEFRNNGLDSPAVYTGFKDAGRGGITGVPADYGKFKVPSFRNLLFTGPYMHDGRFTTLDQVLQFYSFGVNAGPYTDPSMQFAFQKGVHLTTEEQGQVMAFLQSLTDSSLITNPDYSNPFK